MSMGGGSSSANNAIINEQRAEAAKAEAKEKERQGRLKYGRDLIEATFSGGTVTAPGTTVSGTRDIANPKYDPAAAEWFAKNPYAAALAKGFGGKGKITGPGFSYDVGAVPKTFTEEYTEEVPGETTELGGIGQDFYENYRKSLQDFYVPTVNEQFQETKSQNMFDLARKGLLRSSVATDRAGDLLKSKADADATVQSQIEGQVSGLQSDVNRAKTNALGLLTSTEDPTTAANSALTEVNAIQSRSPQFGDLGNLFASALNSYSTFRNAQQGREQLARIPVQGPYASSGRVYG